MVVYSHASRVSKKVDDDETDNDIEVTANGISGGIPGGFTTTNDRGEFRFESVAPGNYKLEVTQLAALTGTGTTEFYGDPLSFEVSSANVDRLEVKVHPGASISGVVVAENADGQSGLQSYGRLVLSASVIDAQTKSYSSGNAAVGEDGTFRIAGLKSGKATIRVSSIGQQDATLLRIERNGAELQEGVDIQPDEQVTGLRLVVTQANCVIKGHVTIEGGTLPPGQPVTVRARRLNGVATDVSDSESAEVDSKGDFEIEDLAPGTYEVEVLAAVPAPQGVRSVTGKQTVTTSSGAPGYVTLVLDIRSKGSDK
jgi:hypothetical protein